ncbi:response regulator [Paenibacillus sepulcri]|uniref:Response regulator n=1 Tax=Paenibacillus sepulcri TaxID=359917 RepID=A0ABS7C0E6_9BACL|nr:response regulator [Paenibacillus sepulcri]
MNLMIVEDEPRLRNALAHNIRWEEHGIDLTGLASNGLEALQLVKRNKPDIMIIDVQMPEMDGLTLVRRLQEQQETKSFMKMIILSGHDNFAFAQDAMEHGVSRYLLKPAGEDEILEAVLEARKQLQEEWEQWQNKAALEQKWKDHLPILQNNFFQNWVNGKLTPLEALKQSKDFYIELKEDDQITVAVVDLDPIPDDEHLRFTPQDRPLLQFTMQCMANELLSHPSCWVSTDADHHLLLVFIAEADQSPNEAMLFFNSAVVKLLSQTKAVLKLTASAGICSSAGSLEEMELLYAQACRALQERMVYGPDIAIPYREVPERSPHTQLAHQSLEKTLEIALETADEHKAMEALAGLWKEGTKQFESADEVHEAVLYLSSLFVRIIQKQGWMVRNVVGDDFIYFQNLKLLQTQVQTWSWLTRIVRHITAFRHNQRRTTSNQMVREILTILDQEIDQEITLHTVADRLYVNSSYLSRLFKQEMGVAFSAYVLERKMERAKAILQEGLKVYDAARLVGYRDVSYFTKVFRKYWGVNPGECKP